MTPNPAYRKGSQPTNRKRNFLTMKITTILLFSACLTATADGHAQNITLSANKVKLEKIFNEIRKQTGYVFFYDARVLQGATPVSIHVKNGSIEEVLKESLQDQPLDFSIERKTITIFKKGGYSLDRNPTVGTLMPLPALLNEIKGIVKDEKGNPLPGVSVIVKGTTKGTSTGTDGSFSIEANAGEVLEFTMVGYQKKSVTVGQASNINVVMDIETLLADEVVVVGYGTQKKEDLTGAISSVSASVLKDRPLTSLGQGLEGTIANLNISPVDGQPGRASTFNIRGYTGLGVSESPLILVDGVIMDPDLVNPADVASVTVLKDAASAAIYGARAAFGVILITTKHGNKNQTPKLNYSGNLSSNSPTRIPKIANSWDTYNYLQSAFGAVPATQDYVDKLHAHFIDPTKPDAELVGNSWVYYSNTNWYHEAVLNHALTNNHDLNVSGGSDKITYYFSGGLLDQGGLYRYGNDSYKKYNFRSDVTFELKSWISLNFKGSYTRTDDDAPTYSYGQGPWWHDLIRIPNTLPVKNPDGQWDTNNGQVTNPIQFLSDGGRDIQQTTDNWVVVGTEIRPFAGFKIKGNVSTNSSPYNERDYKKELFTTLPNGIVTPTTWTTNPYASQTNTTYNYYAINAWGEYEKTFNKLHYFKALLGYNQEKASTRSFNALRFNPITPDVGEISLSTGDMQTNSSAGDWAVRGAFFRLNYIFNEKYLLEVNGRYDGTSKFPKGDRYGFFPSISGGWRISNESFMGWMKPLVNQLKLRASYGTLGNQNVSSDYPYISTMSYYTMTGSNATFQDGNQINFVQPAGLVSPTLTWEKLTTLDFGVDYSMLANRLNLTFDWYNRETDGILGTQAAPAILGTDPPLQNLYDMDTKGWELTYSWRDQINKNLSYNVGFNLSNYTGKVLKYDANPTNYIFDFYKGETIGDLWGWKVDGLFQSDAEAAAWEAANKQSLVFGTPPGGWKAGDMKFDNVNGKNGLDQGSEAKADPGDRIIIGNNTPKYSFGFTAGVQWKWLYVDAFFQGVGKRDWQMGSGDNSLMLFGPEGSSGQQRLAWDYNLDYWRPDNPSAYFPRVGGIRVAETTRYLQNAAYIRLKSLVVGFNIPERLIQRVGIGAVRIYFSGQNLWTYTKLIKSVDPEGLVDPYNYDPGSVYPIQKSLSVGLNVTF